MYFSRITLNPAADHQGLAQSLCHDSYREHQLLWQLFESNPDAKRDFLYRQVLEQGQIKYYILSERKPVNDSGLWVIEPPKEYDPQLHKDQKLFFNLRVNPVITVTGSNGKKQRHDVVMHAKKQLGYRQMTDADKPSIQQFVQDSSLKWLESRAANNGFAIQTGGVVADGYQQHRTETRKQKHRVNFSTVDFQGILTVTDPQIFRNVLYNGIGKAKAFGCGLLLVKRI